MIRTRASKKHIQSKVIFRRAMRSNDTALERPLCKMHGDTYYKIEFYVAHCMSWVVHWALMPIWKNKNTLTPATMWNAMDATSITIINMFNASTITENQLWDVCSISLFIHRQKQKQKQKYSNAVYNLIKVLLVAELPHVEHAFNMKTSRQNNVKSSSYNIVGRLCFIDFQGTKNGTKKMK